MPLSLAVASIFPGSRRRRALESQLIVDESWALAGRSGRFEYRVLIGAGLVLYVVWVGGTALGTVIGDLLDPEAIGLDAAFPALFLALLAPYLRNRGVRSRPPSSPVGSRSCCFRSRRPACRSWPPASPH